MAEEDEGSSLNIKNLLDFVYKTDRDGGATPGQALVNMEAARKWALKYHLVGPGGTLILKPLQTPPNPNP